MLRIRFLGYVSLNPLTSHTPFFDAYPILSGKLPTGTGVQHGLQDIVRRLVFAFVQGGIRLTAKLKHDGKPPVVNGLLVGQVSMTPATFAWPTQGFVTLTFWSAA